MSRITFLDNARLGENNIWRYFFTIILTWGTPIVFQVIIIIFALSLLSGKGLDTGSLLLDVTSNPLVLIALVGVTSVVSIIFLFIGVRFIHQRKFITLVNTDSRFSLRKLLKGGGIWFAILTVSTLIALYFDPTGLKITFNPS